MQIKDCLYQLKKLLLRLNNCLYQLKTITATKGSLTNNSISFIPFLAKLMYNCLLAFNNFLCPGSFHHVSHTLKIIIEHAHKCHQKLNVTSSQVLL